MDFEPLSQEDAEIRLIRYRHWDPEWPTFDFDMGVASLNTLASYRAISYTWGSSGKPITTPFEIIVNGRSVPVSSNLHYALMQVCNTRSRNKWLWVDALCINFDDLNERNWQVANMHRIFASADFVYFSIGPADDDSDRLFDFLVPWGKEAAAADMYPGEGALDHAPLEPYSTTKTGKFIRLLTKTTDIYDKGLHDAIAALARRPHWNRCWIMQELMLAKGGILLCGQKVMRLHHFHAIMLALTRVAEWRGGQPRLGDGYTFSPSAANESMLGIDAHIRGPRPDATLHFFLTSRARIYDTVTWSGPFYESRDPRDIIFAFLGVASDRDHLGIVIDYSIAIRDVYTAATLAMFQSDPRQPILELSSFPKDIRYLPTWVPDWSRIGRLGLQNPLSQLGSFHVFRTRKTIPEITIVDGNILQRRGLACGIVKCAFQFSAFDSKDDSKEWQAAAFSSALEHHRDECVRDMLSFIYLCAFDAVGSEDRPETRLWRAITADTYRKIEKLNGYHDFNRKMLGLEPLPRGELLPVSVHHIWEYGLSDSEETVARHPRKFVAAAWERLVRMARNRTLFATEDGRIGLGPYLMQRGDVVTALVGSRVPAILRPEDSVYRYLGEAYVEGIMYGELGLDESEHQDQAFDIV
ncbi:hypothetical protein LMH87_009619 [Akanthomyces muscarius]|uniref:Heterokaryon incompatibility domain-containing protein n=1 Tax=Akanthomyces muscarius TaxID=2231603 RepID=A0A9W8UJQ4_AKAMU|nr:hypothetical protein LMH87_009619 [Akanthomyces muscarius]KAJ4153114.1 hypothetical protein LMH87_009619 [Akanthomyces muscarius]